METMPLSVSEKVAHGDGLIVEVEHKVANPLLFVIGVKIRVLHRWKIIAPYQTPPIELVPAKLRSWTPESRDLQHE